MKLFFDTNQTRVLTYGQTIRDLLLLWYLPQIVITIVAEWQYLSLGMPELAIFHLIGTLWLLLVGNHMWTGSWFLRPVEF